MSSQTPAALGFSLPAEWAPHARTWLAWPYREETWHGGIEAARAAYVDVAQALVQFEPVTMICNPGDLAEVSLMCGPGIDLVPIAVSDAWVRDVGPTFVANAAGKVAGVDWIFNGWGGLHNEIATDAKLASAILKLCGYRRFAAPIVAEGGALNGDGEGTLLLTEQCLLDERRNPGKTKEDIETVFREMLGVRTIIWLGEGYEGDETRGHVDEVACFVKPGVVLIQIPADAADPNYLIQHDNLVRLRLARDAQGRSLEVIEIQQPARREHDGRRLTLSYVNFAFANGGLVIPSFGDPADELAFRVFSTLFPDRRIVQILADDLATGGGGIHCITQQEPAGM